MIARNGHALVGEPMVDGAGDDRVQRHYSFLMQVEPGGVKGWRWVSIIEGQLRSHIHVRFSFPLDCQRGVAVFLSFFLPLFGFEDPT